MDEKKYIEITEADLPFACPPYNRSVLSDIWPTWDNHPRVYLVFDENDIAICPYCGLSYKIKKA